MSVRGNFPALNMRERLRAWTKSKEALQAEIKNYQYRLNALMCAKDEALTSALLFENEDITKWLQEVSSSSKGALGAELKESRERVVALEKKLSKLVPSEERAWKIINSVIEAWEVAAQMRVANWDAKREEWVPVIRDPLLPQDVLDGLKAWLNRDGQSGPRKRG